ncbi:Uncharacterised protein [Sphingobacterium multivorum]|uniref:Uncharacterized protein n=1 Tax=Sphingobacterium multivorum TaxID=28454 RepID=A0A2X2JQV3_SPHMU|nr:Uncharacterised protein [Sphingobacterium multivorum]SUJ31832.1 Uncharacterised protein [Sphingobacterium multivorum]
MKGIHVKSKPSSPSEKLKFYFETLPNYDEQ